MFGDIGHGAGLVILGAYLILAEKSIRKSDSMFKSMLIGRYLIFFMGCFGMFSGIMYNDFLSIPLDIYGSCFAKESEDSNLTIRKEGCVYPIGIDPKWYIATNELAFINSFKMKFAVIVGVIQMTFGVLLKGFNCIHFSHYLELFFEFIPQMLFMLSTFG